MKIAFLGLGAMGSRMARTILDAGHDLVVWNRSPGKAEPLVAAGATEAESPRAAADGAGIVVSMVLIDAASRAVWLDPDTGALAGMDPDAVAVDCSTVAPDTSRALAEAARKAGVAFVAAPVAGTLPPAETGELVIIAGGDEDAVARAAPAFEAMGKATHHAGPPEAAATTKLLVNGMLAAQEAALAELLAMARRTGVDHRRAFDILCETPVASPMLKAYGQLMIDGTDTVNFPVSGILKDLGLIADASAAAGIDAPVTTGARSSFSAAAEAGLSDANQTEILRRYDLNARGSADEDPAG